MNIKQVLRFHKDAIQGFDRREFYDQPDETELVCDNVISGFFEVVKIEHNGRSELVETWFPPVMKKEGSHMPPRRSRFNARAFIPDVGTNVQIGNASWLELKCAMHFMANRRVVRIEDQSPTIPYVDTDGIERHHRCDFRISFDNSTTLAVAIKPDEKVESRNLDKLKKVLRLNLRGQADDIVILTEAYLTNNRAWNAQSIIRARRAKNERVYQALREVLPDIHGSVSAYDLARLNPSVALGEIAVWRLIYEGALKMVRPERRLCDAPYVTVNHSILRTSSHHPGPTVSLAA